MKGLGLGLAKFGGLGCGLEKVLLTLLVTVHIMYW